MDAIELFRGGEKILITKTSPGAVGGIWIEGRIRGHSFEAKVYAEHALSPDFELGKSRISKLHVQRISDGADLICFDRGWEFKPTDEQAISIRDFLVVHLAEILYGPLA